MYDMLIIGSGPAGMGAAIYGVRAGLSLAVLDRSPISGGQVLTTYEVDNYLGLPQIRGGEISQKFREHADKDEKAKFLMGVGKYDDKLISLLNIDTVLAENEG